MTNSEVYVCGTCGFSYGGSPGDLRSGIPPTTPWEALAPDWHCPNCHAPKSAFHRETASERLPRAGSQTTQQDVIQQLAAIADRKKKHFAGGKNFVVPVGYLGEEIHELALMVSGKQTMSERTILSVFFDERAIRLLKQVSINYYWFWTIVSFAASRAACLPIIQGQIQEAIAHLRSGLAAHVDLIRPLSDLDQYELALRVAYGAMVISHLPDHTYSVIPNPLFQISDLTVGAVAAG
ncbi:MAG TPA: rubredoxin [Candidatus Obscuribacterales bacterium]